MKHIISSCCLLAFLLSNFYVAAQSPVDTTKPEPIFSYVERMPVANYDVPAYILKNLRFTDSLDQIVSARVVLRFVINEDGSPSDVSLVNGATHSLDEEIVRVVRNMPYWKPGSQNNKSVRVWYTMPVNIHFE